jgi:hypothetical protein
LWNRYLTQKLKIQDDFLQYISFDKVVLKKPEEKQFGALFDLEETNIVVTPSVDELAVSDDTHLVDELVDDEK